MTTTATNVLGAGGRAQLNQAPSDLAGDQNNPSVAALAGGGWISVWDTSDGNYIDGAVRDNLGGVIANLSTVNTTTTGRQFDPDVAALIGGNAVVVFTDESAGASNAVIRAELLNPNGTRLGNDFVVSALFGADGGGDQVNADVAGLNDGGFAVTWEDTDKATDHDVEVRLFNADGTPRTAVIQVDGDLGDALDPHVAVLADGGFVVAYSKIVSGESELDFSRYDANGQVVQSVVTADNTGTLDDEPEVVGLPGGGFDIVYRSNGGSSVGNDIWVVRYDSAGVFQGYTNGTAYGALGEGNQSEPTIAVLPNGSIVVGWTDDTFHETTLLFVDINAALSFPSREQADQMAIARLDDGRLAVVWHDIDSSDHNIGTEFAELVRQTAVSTAEPDTVVGDSLRDLITGNNGADQLSGGGGNDEINGGLGDDRIDGGPGRDTAVFAGNVGAYAITRSGLITTVVGPDGTDTLTAIERLEFGDTTRSVYPATNDFNGDGTSDILFSSSAGAIYGAQYEWQLSNRTISGQGAIDLYDKTFSVQVAGDFDGDGKSDLVFENPNTGGVWEWRLNGNAIVSQGAVDVGDSSYHLLGNADFNGDGRSDLLWRSNAGFVYEWQMFGRSDTPVAVGGLDVHWHIVGAGDFSGDGNADLLLRNISGTSDNGAFFLWTLNGATIVGQGGIERPSTQWVTLGVGDFDGDGKADFAVRNVSNSADNGAVWVYLMNGTAIKAQGAAGIADAATWHVQEIGDLNGDGKDDILFRNDGGYFYSWDMNGTTIGSEGAVPWADPNQHVVGQHWDLV